MIDYLAVQPNPEPFESAEIIQDYAEFSGQLPSVVADKVLRSRELIRQDFSVHGDKFYANSKIYIYDNIAANPTLGIRANLLNKFIPDGIKRIMNHPGNTFADFGGGVGVMSQIAEDLGKTTTYIDIRGHTADFAMWRKEKHGFKFDIHLIDEQDFTFPQTYDIIFTDSVWEHLDEQKQQHYITKFYSGLKPGGMLYFLVDLAGKSDDMPIHYDVNIWEMHSVLYANGLRCEHGQNTFASVWYK